MSSILVDLYIRIFLKMEPRKCISYTVSEISLRECILVYKVQSCGVVIKAQSNISPCI